MNKIDNEFYEYTFAVGRKIVYKGISNDLEMQETELRKKWPKGQIIEFKKLTGGDGE